MLRESTIWPALAGAIAVCAVASAQAEEQPIELATGPGRDAVEKYCGSACDSLDYLTTNSPILDRQGWTIEVNKMIEAFGAPIKPDETRIIVDYLVKNCGTGVDVRSTQGR